MGVWKTVAGSADLPAEWSKPWGRTLGTALPAGLAVGVMQITPTSPAEATFWTLTAVVLWLFVAILLAGWWPVVRGWVSQSVSRWMVVPTGLLFSFLLLSPAVFTALRFRPMQSEPVLIAGAEARVRLTFDGSPDFLSISDFYPQVLVMRGQSNVMEFSAAGDIPESQPLMPGFRATYVAELGDAAVSRVRGQPLAVLNGADEVFVVWQYAFSRAFDDPSLREEYASLVEFLSGIQSVNVQLFVNDQEVLVETLPPPSEASFPSVEQFIQTRLFSVGTSEPIVSGLNLP